MIVAAVGFGTWLQAWGEDVPPHVKDMMTEENVAKVEAGDIVVFTNNEKGDSQGAQGKGRMMVLINAPCGEVWKHLTTFEKQHEFMPHLQSITMYRHEGNLYGLQQTLKIVLKTVTYHVLQTRDDESHVLRFELDRSKPNDIVETKGSWVLTPHGEGKTIAVYQVQVDSGFKVADFLQNFVMNYDLQNLAQALRRRSESGGTYTKSRQRSM